MTISFISTLHELIRVLLTTKWEGNRSRITYVWFLTPYKWLLTRPSTRQGIFWKHFLFKSLLKLGRLNKTIAERKDNDEAFNYPEARGNQSINFQLHHFKRKFNLSNYKVNFCVRGSLHLLKTRWEIFFILRQLKVINPFNSCHLYLCTDNTGKLDADWFIWYDLS